MPGRVARVAPSSQENDEEHGHRLFPAMECGWREESAPRVTVAATEALIVDAENTRVLAGCYRCMVGSCSLASMGLVVVLGVFFAYTWIQAFRKVSRGFSVVLCLSRLAVEGL